MPVNSPTAPGFLVGRVAHLLRVRMACLIKQKGFAISAEECVVLNMIVQADRPLRVGELAAMSSRDPTTLKRQLDGLIKNELIFRTADARDGRAVVVRATHAGREVITELSSPFDDLCEETMANISTDELDVLRKSLQLMLQNLHEASRSADTNAAASQEHLRSSNVSSDPRRPHDKCDASR